MDMSVLCGQIIDWYESGQSGAFPDGGVLGRIGPSSIAFVPIENSNCVVKVIKPGHNPNGLSIQEEFKLMNQLQGLEGEHFVTPVPISCGANPDFISMVRLGRSFSGIVSDPEVIQRIGLALGEFSAQLFMKYGSVHADICPGNYTDVPGGKIGVIDIAAIVKTNIPEKMFLVPILDPFNICPLMAEKFEEVSGRSIDFDLVEQLSRERLPRLLASKPPDVAAKIASRHDANLDEWRNLRGHANTSRRPCAKKKICPLCKGM